MGFCEKADCIAPAHSRGLCREHARQRDTGVRNPRPEYGSSRERVYEGVRRVYEAETEEEYRKAWARLRAASKAWLKVD